MTVGVLEVIYHINFNKIYYENNLWTNLYFNNIKFLLNPF